MSDTRTVHAFYDGMEIVRYDRAGKWYAEPTNPRLKRQRLTLAQAVALAQYAMENGGGVRLGLPGGEAFDRKVSAS